jgi:hypothetical protein
LNTGKILVIAQVSISLVLLTGAGLFARTLRNLKNAELGYDRENLLIIRIDPLAAGEPGFGPNCLICSGFNCLRFRPRFPPLPGSNRPCVA